MPWTSEHTKWLVDTGERLKTADGKEVEVWEFRHEKDEAMLSAWARHPGITTALTAKSIIGAEGTSALAESISTP